MSEFTIRAAGTTAPRTGDHDRLRQATRQLEGVFVQELFKAMRATLPEGGAIDGGTGEEIFSGLLDQHLASQVPADWERGLGAALYRQLRGALAPEGARADEPTP